MGFIYLFICAFVSKHTVSVVLCPDWDTHINNNNNEQKKKKKNSYTDDKIHGKCMLWFLL